jgi:hypothetical protein
MKTNAPKRTVKKTKSAIAKCRERMGTYTDIKRDQIQDVVNKFFGRPNVVGRR